MELTWLGKQAFSLSSDGITCLIDPAKGLSFPSAQFAVITDSDKSLYDTKTLEKVSYVVDWPGEYEVQGHLIEGIEIQDVGDGAVHTMMSITTIDHVTVAHLGMLESVPESSRLEKLGTVHVLILPLSEKLKLEQLTGIIDTISPGVVIPAITEDQDISAFLKHYGKTDLEPLNSFKMARPEQIPETPDIVLLTNKNK